MPAAMTQRARRCLRPSQQDFRQRLFSTAGQLAQLRRHRLERGVDLRGESLTENLAMIGLGQPAVVETAHMKIAGHAYEGRRDEGA
jgi:hypothetical protein